MTIDFTDDSGLKIVPENKMESYALQKWFEGYCEKGREYLTLEILEEDRKIKNIVEVKK